MLIQTISDIHGKLPPPAPACDAIIIAGDICPDLRPIEAQGDWLNTTFRRWLQEQPARVYATWGNHDLCGERKTYPIDLPWTLLVNQLTEIEGVQFYFTPYVPRLPHWAFSQAGDDIPKHITDRMPMATDVLVSHAAPWGYADYLRGAGHLGCKNLLARCEEVKPALIICGHIHDAYGSATTPWGNIENVASLDDRYRERAIRWIPITI